MARGVAQAEAFGFGTMDDGERDIESVDRDYLFVKPLWRSAISP
jgi:hypothetical protein